MLGWGFNDVQFLFVNCLSFISFICNKSKHYLPDVYRAKAPHTFLSQGDSPLRQIVYLIHILNMKGFFPAIIEFVFGCRQRILH